MTYKNDTAETVEITFYTDPRYYEPGHVPDGTETTATHMIEPGAMLMFDTTEDNGPDIAEACLAASMGVA